MGLLQFAKTMTVLWHAANQDDPYAEWYLLKTYQCLTQAKATLKAIEAQLLPYFNEARGMDNR